MAITNLSFESKLAEKYPSQPQKIRVLTEHWVDNQVFCPNCGQLNIDKYENNKPVADFFCSNCNPRRMGRLQHSAAEYSRNVTKISSPVRMELKKQHSSALETFIYTNEYAKA